MRKKSWTRKSDCGNEILTFNMIGLRSTLVLLILHSAVLTVFANEPYLVQVHGGHDKFCNGVLIQKNAVLTGFHCVDGIAQKDIAVVAGAGDTCNKDTVQQFSIKSVYSNDTLHLAILQLSSSATINEYVDVIAQSGQTNLMDYNEVKLKGRSDGKTCQVKHFNCIRITKCPASIPDFALCGYSTVLGKMHRNGKTGAPYVAFDKTLSKDVLLGIDSNGPYPGKGGLKTKAVFVDASKNNEWITETHENLN